MRAKIEIEMGNAAFEDDPAPELVRILRKLADDIESSGADTLPLRDINGNRVGIFDVFAD